MYHESFDDLPEDIVIRQKKELLEGQETKVRLYHIYRVRVNKGGGNTEEVIWFTKITSGYTGIGNYVEYEETPKTTSIWYEPIVGKKVIFDPEKEQMKEIPVEDDLSKTIVHYEYPFNKENIKMINDGTKDNQLDVHWYVLDLATNFSRSVDNFSDWSTKPFSDLLRQGGRSSSSSKPGSGQGPYNGGNGGSDNNTNEEISELKQQVAYLRGALQDNINQNHNNNNQTGTK